MGWNKSRDNGGAPVPAPMVALLFRRVLTFVCPTPVPPTPHPVHPSHPSQIGSNQPAHRNPSRANGGAPVPELPFRRALTTVRPTPVPQITHPVHPSHPSHPISNQPMHKTMCPHPADTIQSNQPIQSSQSIRYDPVIQSSQYNPDNTIQSS